MQIAVVSVFVVLPVYIRIAFLVRKLKKSEPRPANLSPEAQMVEEKQMKQRKMATTMGLVLGAFLGSYLPSIIYSFAHLPLFKPPYPFGILLTNRILNILYWMQNAVNPFIYGYRNKAFAKYYRKILHLPAAQMDDFQTRSSNVAH